MRTAGVVVSCTGRCFAVLFFFSLDVLVDEGVSGDTYPLCLFVTCSGRDGMGRIKALDGWMGRIAFKIPVQGVKGRRLLSCLPALFVCFRPSRMMLLVATARCYG